MDNPLLRPDPGLFIWTILTFLVLVALLTKFAWRPLLAALDSRQDAIRKSLDAAQQARQALEPRDQESVELFNRARAEADQVIVRSRADAERLREDMKQKRHLAPEPIDRGAGRQMQLENAR